MKYFWKYFGMFWKYFREEWCVPLYLLQLPWELTFVGLGWEEQKRSFLISVVFLFNLYLYQYPYLYLYIISRGHPWELTFVGLRNKTEVLLIEFYKDGTKGKGKRITRYSWIFLEVFSRFVFSFCNIDDNINGPVTKGTKYW